MIQHDKRIMIFGLPGAGKSTFAAQLASQLQLPLYHIDRYFFIGNWQERPTQEFLLDQAQLVAQDSWIIEGNATRSFEMRYARTEIAIYFKFNRLICLYRLFKRWLLPDYSLRDTPDGAKKNITWPLIKYMWGYDKRVREELKILAKRYPQVKLWTICSPAQGKKTITFFSSYEIKKYEIKNSYNAFNYNILQFFGSNADI